MDGCSLTSVLHCSKFLKTDLPNDDICSLGHSLINVYLLEEMLVFIRNLIFPSYLDNAFVNKCYLLL